LIMKQKLSIDLTQTADAIQILVSDQMRTGFYPSLDERWDSDHHAPPWTGFAL